ncbi:hypothetical protein BD779DRAFT_1526136 [Infundibulicybe gibba]|nr:hypothetical protein BD779DRAFT_1526136 [Infundibulicybe gibba]
MSGNSYPSPVSSSASSPNLDENASSVNPVIFEEDSRPIPSRSETQRSLHQASAALEAAYRRIRQVRSSLLELSDRLPTIESPRRVLAQNDLAPGYQALVLTEVGEDQDDSLEREETDIFPQKIVSTERRWRAQSPVYGIRDTDSSNPSSHQTMNSPTSPSRLPNFPRLSWIESQQARRRDSHSDDPSTALGRRVAAREAAGSTGSRSPSMDSQPANRIPLFDSDYERTRIPSRQRNTHPLRYENNFDWRPPGTDNRPTRSLDNPMFSTFAPDMQHSRAPVRSETRQSTSQSATSQHSARLSSLSSFSAHGLSTPAAEEIVGPLLFSEPTSYDEPTRQDSDTRERVTLDNGEERTYIVRRRTNADGAEIVTYIRMGWEDDNPDRLASGDRERSPNVSAALYPNALRPPRAPLRLFGRTNTHHRNDTIQVSRTVNTTISPPETARRGWARLDPMGNEIPLDEEQELERIRAEARVRALASSALLRPTGPVPGGRMRTMSLLPSEPVSLQQESVLFADTFPTMAVYQTTIGADETGPDPPSPESPLDYTNEFMSPGPVVPFCSNPLPMPLSEMMPKPRDPTRRNTTGYIKVPSNASFAGR